MIYDFYGEDELNLNGERNIQNTSKIDYNCGGYALETFNWYMPYEKELRYKLYGVNCGEYTLEQTLQIAIDFMLKDFNGSLRLIDSVEELKDNEYAIAFKIGNHDFHYAKRSKSGNWFHKMGGNSKIFRMSKEKIFSDSWINGYVSKTVLFAKARPQSNIIVIK